MQNFEIKVKYSQKLIPNGSFFTRNKKNHTCQCVQLSIAVLSFEIYYDPSGVFKTTSVNFWLIP